MRWAADSSRWLMGVVIAAACRAQAPTHNPYQDLPAPDPAPDLDARAHALEQRAAEAAARARALAEEAERLSALESCGCEGRQACRVRCEPPAEPRCECEPAPSCACVQPSAPAR